MPNILLGVCGGIAAYKSCDLVREFQGRGCGVRVLMTKAARKFVAPLTFEALTRERVLTDLFSDGSSGTAHIEWARWADHLVVAPATANTISRFAQGRASDGLSTVYLAFRGPVTLAPAMNTAMWEHAAVQANLALLKERGVRLVGPETGELACGETGPGKMADPARIAEEVLGTSAPRSWSGKSVLITAGATREYLDPVRFLSNPSTGKMGFELAREAARRGARVTLVHGPTGEKPSAGVVAVPVTTAEEMFRAVKENLPVDVFVGAAAVADYAPVRPSETKLKKDRETWQLDLRRTPAILEYVSGERAAREAVVGFAAETDRVVPHAKLKLEAKRLDLIVANRVYREREGFAADRTTVWILDRSGGTTEHADVSKETVARLVWDRIEKVKR